MFRERDSEVINFTSTIKRRKKTEVTPNRSLFLLPFFFFFFAVVDINEHVLHLLEHASKYNIPVSLDLFIYLFKSSEDAVFTCCFS